MSVYRLIDNGMEPHTYTYHYSLFVGDRCLMANKPYRECSNLLLALVKPDDRYEEIDFEGNTRCVVSGMSVLENHRLQQARFRENAPL